MTDFIKALEAGQRFKCDTAKAAHAEAKRTGLFDEEAFGFAQELAYQYGASHIDDDAKVFVITAEDLYVLMRVLGYSRVTP